ncbi:MAG: hypothetical protein IJZ64_06845 [Ruminococcus sp.]|nr:hypothetical protein [Ruminococcus sp.]
MKVKLCKRCGTKIFNPANATKYCANCRQEVAKVRYIERYYWLKEHRMCVECGHERAKQGKIHCKKCAEEARVRATVYKFEKLQAKQ